MRLRDDFNSIIDSRSFGSVRLTMHGSGLDVIIMLSVHLLFLSLYIYISFLQCIYISYYLYNYISCYGPVRRETGLVAESFFVCPGLNSLPSYSIYGYFLFPGWCLLESGTTQNCYRISLGYVSYVCTPLCFGFSRTTLLFRRLCCRNKLPVLF